MKCLIYGLVDPQDSLIHYIGKSSTGMKRPLQHREPNSRKRKNAKNVWLDSMPNGMTYDVVVLETVRNPGTAGHLCWWWTGINATALNDAERWWIAYGRACGWPLVNESDGGEGNPGRVVSAETRAKQSAAHSTPEQIEALRARCIGRKASPETRSRISKAKTGTKHTDETKAKMSASRMGRPNLFWRERGGGFAGHHHTEETRKRLSESQLGKRMSHESSEKKRKAMTTPEHVARMSGDNNPMRRPEVKAKALASRALRRVKRQER